MSSSVDRNGPEKSILVIDDHPAIARLIELFLKHTHYSSVRLLKAGTHNEAIEILAAERPDLILVDNRVPPFESFRSPMPDLTAAAGETPIILLTGAPPKDLGHFPEDRHIRDVWMKDDLGIAFLIENLEKWNF